MANPLGNITGGVVGAGVGIAAANVAEPVLEVERQQAWSDNAYRVLELGDLAHLVAQGLVRFEAAAAEARRNGYGPNKLAARVQLALEAPPYSEVLALWRRNRTRPADEQITDEQVEHALAKAQIEPQYWPALKELVNARLSAQELALAVVRGLVPDPGILPVSPPTEPGKVPAFPVFDIDVLAEALADGFDRERLAVLVGTMGRPMPVNEAARATFRDIIGRTDFDRAIAEGDVRNEWRDALLDVAREILSATQYAESHLRGYTATEEEMYANMAKHGMSREDARLLFLNQGRPLSIHQITTGLARGGEYNGPTDQIPQAFLDAVRESNIKPPYYNLDYANRYTYPSGFQIRGEAQRKTLSFAETRQILLEIGWSPKWAEHFARSWTQPGSAQKEATAADLLTLYDGGFLELEPTRAALLELGYDPDAVQQKLDLPDARRAAAAKNTAIADLHTAFKKGEIDRPAVEAALDQLGLNPLAAGSIVQSWQVYLDALA